jgi:hypothetical protein
VQPQSAVSFDLVTRVLDLFSRAQPLLCDSARLNSDATLLLFDLQLVETIMEMCHGPHERNQRLVFASTFLPSANRVFSTLTYVAPPPPSLPTVAPTRVPTVQSLPPSLAGARGDASGRVRRV